MKKIAVVGELLWDCIGEQKTAAGAPYNFARQFQLVGGYPVLLTAVGEDEVGEALKSAALRSGIRALIQKSSHQTGYARVFSEQGQNRFELGNPAAWDEIAWNEAAECAVSDADALYFGTLAQRNAVSRGTIRALGESFRGKMRFCDLNLRPPFDSREVVLWSLSHCDVLKISDGERQQLCGILNCSYEEVIDVCFAHFEMDIILETLGEKGARGYRRNGEFVCIPAPQVEVISTVGAGDAFFAAFAIHWLGADSLYDSVEFAAAHAARVISAV